MDDSSHCVIAMRAEAERPRLAAARHDAIEQIRRLRVLGKCVDGPSNAARRGSRSEAWSSIRPGGRPSALQLHGGRVGPAARCPESVHEWNRAAAASAASRGIVNAHIPGHRLEEIP